MAKKKAAYHHGDLKNALIQAAARLTEKRRDTAFTMREVAAEAGVSHAAAYRHFTSKVDILAAVAETGFGRLRAAFEAVASNDPHKELLAQGEAYVRFAIAHAGYFRAMFHSDLGDHAAYEGLAQVSGSAFDSLLTVITRGVNAGMFSKREPMELALLSWATVHGLANLLVDQRLTALPAEMTGHVLVAMMNGVLART